MRDLLRSICSIGAVAIWVLMTAVWIGGVVVGAAGLLSGDVFAAIAGFYFIWGGITGLVNEWQVFQERLLYCTQGDFRFDIFGIPVSFAGVTGTAGNVFGSLPGLTCLAADRLLTLAESSLAGAQGSLDTAKARRVRLRRRVATAAAVLVAAVGTVALVTFTAPWQLPAAIAAVAVATAAVVAAGAELAALEAEIRMLEGVISGAQATVKDLQAQVAHLCPQATPAEER